MHLIALDRMAIQTGKFDKHILMWYTPENENVGV